MPYLSRVWRWNLGHSLLQFNSLVRFVPKVLLEMPAHTNSFFVTQARLVRARACQSDSRTSKSTWRLAEGCFGPTLLAPTEAGWRAAGQAPPILLSSVAPARHADTLSLCQLPSSLPPFKSLSLLPLGQSVPPHQRLQGLFCSRLGPRL